VQVLIDGIYKIDFTEASSDDHCMEGKSNFYIIFLLLISSLSAYGQSIPHKSFVFIRHGDAGWSMDDLPKGPLDNGLTPKGHCEADQASRIIQRKGLKPKVIYVSPLKRAQQTALYLASQPASLIQTVDGLQERNYGHPSPFGLNHLQQTEPDPLSFPQAETPEAFQQRVLTTIAHLLEEEQQPIVIISHSGVFKCLCQYLTGQSLAIDYGGIVYFQPPQGFCNPNWVVEWW